MSAPDHPIDVFVIHVAADAPRAAALSFALRAHGLRPFSARDLKPGDMWDTVLPAAMTRARALAVVISTHWPRAGEPGKPWYGPDEVARAIDLARTVEPPPRLIPIWIDGAVDRTPYGLRRVSGIHVTGHAFAAAAADIAGILDPTVAYGHPRPRVGVDAARDRLAHLRADGASAKTLAAATEDVKHARRAARDGPAPRAGDVFADRYRLLDRLGDGGFATVWRAKDLRTDTRVALKILHGRWSHDRSRVERFCRGAERMAALEHPSVVRVLAKPSTHLGWHFYVMECLACDLHAARTRAASPLSARQAVEAVLTVADALAVAHARGMVHRDVKPQNILLDERGRAKLTDFDLVRADDSTGGTRAGALGTFLFAAPEALAAGKDATPAADVYGLGVCTIFALSGRVPPDVVRAPERVIAALDASARVKAMLRRALDWDAERRPPDAGVFAAELRAVALTKQPRPTPRAVVSSSQTWSSSHPMVGRVIGTITLLLLVLTGGWLWIGSGGPDAIDEGVVELAEPPDGFVLVPAGQLEMGSLQAEGGRDNDEDPRHTVRFSHPLWVQVHEVTQEQWQGVMGNNPSYNPCLECPVERVNWFEAVSYANALSRRDAVTECYSLSNCNDAKPGEDLECEVTAGPVTACEGYRLPTEAEWEYFARAGTNTRYWSGDEDTDLARVGWYTSNANATKPVGQKPANPWGLFDVHGNVYEWTQDWYGPYLYGTQTDPEGPPLGTSRVLRGGAYYTSASTTRSARRSMGTPGYRSRGVGLRLVRNPPAPSRRNRATADGT